MCVEACSPFTLVLFCLLEGYLLSPAWWGGSFLESHGRVIVSLPIGCTRMYLQARKGFANVLGLWFTYQLLFVTIVQLKN